MSQSRGRGRRRIRAYLIGTTAGDRAGLSALLGVLSTVLWTAGAAAAQDSPLHGFAQVNYSVRVAQSGEAEPESDFLLGDERVQLELSRFSESGITSFASKTDLYRDAVDGRDGLEVREAYVSLSSGRLDLRLGRQIVTWGVGDLVFISDVFPKDWTALLAGRPLQYLKRGSDAANLDIHLDALSLQVIAIPFFEADLLPQGRRLLAFDPFPQVPRHTVEPKPSPAHTEVAVRAYRYLGAFDASMYAYRGYWRSPPAMRFDGRQVVAFYPELSVYAASLQGGWLDGVLSLEGGLYDSREDRVGTDAAVENGQVRFLAGYQRAFGDQLTVGLQYYAERVLDYAAYGQSLPAGSLRRKEMRHSATLRLTRVFRYETVRLSLFAWGSPNEEDYFLNPELRYSISDEMWTAIGANVFGGRLDHTFFGQFDRNDNLYATLRYGF